jgi:hypothetical protein
VQLTYSPDVTPSDFIFGYPKAEIAGFAGNPPPDIPSEIRCIFQEIAQEIFVAVYDE